MQSRDALITELAGLVTEAVNLQNFDRSKITADTLLAQGGLELDSVDILEIVVAIEHRYGVKVKDGATAKLHFRNFGTIADFVRSGARP